MKCNLIKHLPGHLICTNLIVAVFFCLTAVVKGQTETISTNFTNVSMAEVVKSTHMDIYSFQDVVDKFKADRNKLGTALINILTNGNSSNFSQCTAEYY